MCAPVSEIIASCVMSEETAVGDLLNSWGLDEFIDSFREKGILEFEVLKHLTNDDLYRLIPDTHFGLRVKFRTKLFEWRAEKAISNIGDTISFPVDNWLLSSPVHNQSNSVATSPCLESEACSKNTSLILSALLESSLQGKSIVSSYKEHGILLKSARHKLTNIIAEFWMNQDRKTLTPEDYNKAADEILKNFPTEEKETYIGSGKKRGSLRERYYTLRKSLGFKRKGSNSIRVTENCVESDDSSTSFTEEQKEDYNWLLHNKSPEDLVVSKWKATFTIRRKDMLNRNINILEKWPILKQKLGATLIELDFERLYPRKSSQLFMQWQLFFEKCSAKVPIQLKDAASKNYISLLQHKNEDTRNVALCYILISYLVPQTIKEKKTKQWKPSISDSQTSFLVIVSDINYILSTINQKKNNCVSHKCTLQPLIIAISPDDINFNNFFVFYNDITYEVESMIKAISITFQIYQVLQLEYPKECCQIWYLLEEAIYGISASGEKSVDLCALIGNLKN